MISKHQETASMSPMASPTAARIAVLLAVLIIGGCASDWDYSVEDPNFGEAVRYTVALQTADPNTGARGLHGEKAEAVMRGYKEFQKIDPPDPITEISIGQ